MTSNFGKWLARLVSSFGIIYKNSVSFWKKGFFADLPKTLTYYHIRTWTAFWSNSRFLVWFVGGKNCPFPLCVISCPYIWYIFNLRSFGPRNNRGIAVWPSLHLHSPFFGKSAKTPFFQWEPHFFDKIPNQPTSQADHLPKFDVILTRNNRDIAVWPPWGLKRKTVTRFWQGSRVHTYVNLRSKDGF